MTLISQTSEYALRALVYLASRPGQACPTAQISANTAVPAHYLGKVLQSLVRSGVLLARRGPGGGCQLAISPHELTVLDVVNAVDPLEHVRRCPLGREPNSGVLCPLHRHLEEAINSVEEAFRSATIGELAAALHVHGGCTLEPDHD